jgi:hypothetical protein
MRIRRALAASFVIAAGLMISPAGLAGFDAACAAAGEGANRVVVVVQTGNDSSAPVRNTCVRFSEDSITGIDALKRANVDAVIKTYGSMGAFVCSILGVGPSYDDCPSSGTNWSYWRATYPATTFAASRVGASSTNVHDGDVEGWRFGGSAPPYSSVVAVCGGAEPTARASTSSTTTVPASASTTTPTATTQPASGGQAAPTTAAPAVVGQPAVAPAARTGQTTSTIAASGVSPTETAPLEVGPPRGGPTTPQPMVARSQPVAVRRPATDHGSPWPVAITAVVLAGLAAATLRARRANRRLPT